MKKLAYFVLVLFLLPTFKANAQWDDILSVSVSADVTNDEYKWDEDHGSVEGISMFTSTFEARVAMYIYRTTNLHPKVEGSAYGRVQKPSGTGIGSVYAMNSTREINKSMYGSDIMEGILGARKCSYELFASITANTEGYAYALVRIDWNSF